MPDGHDVAGMIGQLPSRVALPADFFEKQGAVGTLLWEDFRQFPRFYLRFPAALEVRPSLPALFRSRQPQRVYVKDISRVSIAVLHSEQLFPGERLRLTLIDGVERCATVARCRRIQANCYEVAARLDGTETAG